MLALSARPYLTDPITVIDVGACNGDWIREFRKYFEVGFSIGIDPCNRGYAGEYSVFYEKAIINSDKDEERLFHEYIEYGCNSLLEMKTESIVHDRSEDGWYVGWEIEKQTGERMVNCTSLAKIIEENSSFPPDFIKIDTQGTDIEVVKSIGHYLPYIGFIQIESVSSQDKNITLYHNQSLMEDDIAFMESIDFAVLDMEDYSDIASPEANILFYNTVKYGHLQII